MAHSREGVEPCDPTCTRPTGCRGTPPPGRTTATRPTRPPSSATAVPRSIPRNCNCSAISTACACCICNATPDRTAHPFALYFDPHWQPAYDYFSREPIAESGVSDYVAESGASLAPSGYRAGVENFSNPHPSYEFQWGLADVIGALLGAGLQLERLEEYPYANGWAGFDGMRDGGGGRMLPPADRPRLPLMYGLSARKPR